MCCYGQAAPDWTLNDCDGNSHTLYEKLDSQEVVVMFFVMGCYSCTNAGDFIDRMNERYDVSYPGKVNFYLMDYWQSNTCYDVDTTWSTYNFDAFFSGCWSVKDYYFPTLYPMPAVVVAGGSNHLVLYEDLSWQNSDTTLIENSINAVINNLGIDTDEKPMSLSVFPNPASKTVMIQFSEPLTQKPSVKIYSVTGMEIKNFKMSYDQNTIILDFQNPQAGEYIVEFTGSGKTIRKKFVVLP